MAITKTPININFAEGLDQKADPKQIPVGKFSVLNNRVFNKAGLLSKRNGFGSLPALPDDTTTYLTTFGGNLTAIGTSIKAYSQGSQSWINKGTFQPLTLKVLPVGRSAINQIQCDSVVASNNFVCTVFTQKTGSTSSYWYSIQDSNTGQYIVAQTLIPVVSGAVTGSPRVFLLGGYFIIVFTNVISAVSHLQYIAISTSSAQVVVTNTDIAAAYISATTLSWDAVVVGTNLYIAYNTTAGGQQIKITYLNTNFIVATPIAFASSIATIMSMTADLTNPSQPIIYAAFWDASGSTGNAIAVDQNLFKKMSATQWLASGSIDNVTCTAQNGILTIVYEVANNYSYDSGIASNFLKKNTITLPATVTTGTLGSAAVVLRSVGLASKGFLMSGLMYMLTAYDGKASGIQAFQPTYFLIDINGNAITKQAYANGGGYLTLGLPQAQVVGTTVNIAYLFRDLIQSVNKTQGAASSAGVYSQTGINLGSITYGSETLSTVELGNNLLLSGGFLYAYDGNTLNEQNFHLYPDSIEATWSTTGGAIHAQPDGTTNTNAYFYQVIYQWTDAQGNIFNSAPSIPISVTTSGSGTSGSITVNIPTARISYKTGIKIVIFRWSVAQQEYFSVTSITTPTLNDPTVDSIAFVDTLADASIIGNSLIYTTGGVIEDTGGPPCTGLTIFDTRLWLIDAEDQNLLWFSKQVIEGTTVEMSDLLTDFIAPNAGTSTNTGPLKCIFPMDDKIIFFKKDALYYKNGTGPDNTGLNSQFSQPIFITSTIGSENQNSIVFMPQGLLFQSDKGIWLLDRSLGTSYIGNPVEDSNSQIVTSAVAIPATTHVRLTLNNNTVLMYDYFFEQWGTFSNVDAVSSTLYQNLHTYVSPFGGVAQETPGIYIDNGNPVLTNLATGWINIAALQGFQRIYYFYLLGQYFSPHKLNISIAYNYNDSPFQTDLITPNNFSSSVPSPYGDQPAPFGSPVDLEQWKIHARLQKCQAFKITIQEIFDPSFGTAPGAGFSLSGLNMIVAVKRGSRPIPAVDTAG